MLLPHPQREMKKIQRGSSTKSWAVNLHGNFGVLPSHGTSGAGFVFDQDLMFHVDTANDYRSPMKDNPELLNSLHSVYLLAKIPLHIQLEKRIDFRKLSEKKMLSKNKH